eukprot:5790454-Karenia_brevis.AAC.1
MGAHVAKLKWIANVCAHTHIRAKVDIHFHKHWSSHRCWSHSRKQTQHFEPQQLHEIITTLTYTIAIIIWRALGLLRMALGAKPGLGNLRGLYLRIRGPPLESFGTSRGGSEGP